MLVVAIVVGVLVGFLGFLPLLFAIKKIRYVDPTRIDGLIGWFFLSLVLSFVILLCAVLAFRALCASEVIPFAIAEIFTFVIVTIAYGLYISSTKKKGK